VSRNFISLEKRRCQGALYPITSLTDYPGSRDDVITGKRSTEHKTAMTCKILPGIYLDKGREVFIMMATLYMESDEIQAFIAGYNIEGCNGWQTSDFETLTENCLK